MSKLDQVLQIDPPHELHFKGMLNVHYESETLLFVHRRVINIFKQLDYELEISMT